jgi:hypothetical protein
MVQSGEEDGSCISGELFIVSSLLPLLISARNNIKCDVEQFLPLYIFKNVNI